MIRSTESSKARSWAHGRIAATPADHLTERILQPAVLHFQGGQHEVFLALKILVKGGLADADIDQNLVQVDVAEAVAITTTYCRLRQPLSRLPEKCGRIEQKDPQQILIAAGLMFTGDLGFEPTSAAVRPSCVRGDFA
jgi:hypothetical protein